MYGNIVPDESGGMSNLVYFLETFKVHNIYYCTFALFNIGFILKVQSRNGLLFFCNYAPKKCIILLGHKRRIKV